MPGHDPTILPPVLPVPVDDGAAGHLTGALLPRVALRATSGEWVNLGFLTRPTVLFFYPRTGVPGQPPSPGFNGEDWDTIPGARGCTPQSCGFRDLHAEFAALGVDVFGVSTSTTEHQREFKVRMHVPYEILSDSDLALVRSMHLPTFEFPVESGGPTLLLRRMAWLVEHSARGPRITRVWYPVFPPDRNAAEVLAWLKGRAGSVPVRHDPAPAASAPEVRIAPVAPSDLDFVRSELCRHWHATTIWSRDKAYRADTLPAFVAWRAGERCGLATYAALDREVEIVTVSSTLENHGVGSALMSAVELAARSGGARRVFLTTSNDNLRALRFYQRRGYRLVCVHRGMMDRYRERVTALPVLGMNGIPLHDEIELELTLDA